MLKKQIINMVIIPENSTNSEVFETVYAFLEELKFTVVATDQARPWGGFFVLDEEQSSRFISHFFSEYSDADFKGFGKLSPKILVVAPEKRLSWQYHHRRSEIWKLIGGVAGVIKSDTDTENEISHLEIGSVVKLKCGERHRLIGTQGYGIIAEIWQHEDANNPSDEDDIVRVQDDFGR